MIGNTTHVIYGNMMKLDAGSILNCGELLRNRDAVQNCGSSKIAAIQ